MANLTAAKLRRQAARLSKSRSASPDTLLQELRSGSTSPLQDQPNTVSRIAPVKRKNAEGTPQPNDVEFPLHPVAINLPSSSKSIPSDIQPAMSFLRPVRLLVASLGNPPPYHSTRHSAGHIILRSFAADLHFPPLRQNKSYGGGSVSVGADVGYPEYTLWQSSSLMNISGVGVLKAWKSFLSQQKALDGDITAGLIILHDELESPLGQLKVRRGEGSAKGHNGIKSVQASLQGAGMLSTLGDRFVKIGVGIGRPVSRERDDVSTYVLGQLTGSEKEKVEAAAAGKLHGLLRGELARMGS